jgi:hypothetical protein
VASPEGKPVLGPGAGVVVEEEQKRWEDQGNRVDGARNTESGVAGVGDRKAIDDEEKQTGEEDRERGKQNTGAGVRRVNRINQVELGLGWQRHVPRRCHNRGRRGRVDNQRRSRSDRWGSRDIHIAALDLRMNIDRDVSSDVDRRGRRITHVKAEMPETELERWVIGASRGRRGQGSHERP